MGADLETALVRFGTRVRTRAASRVVTLLTEAMNASGNLATVLRTAARQAAADRRLKRARQQAMLEYMVVVYISFLVFLFIIAVLAGYMLPTLQAAAVEGGSESLESSQVEGLSGLDSVDAATYTLLFYHATLIQGRSRG
ncbi:type II secretion system F family protein [Saliphagus sp. GCM10025308]